MTDDVTAAYRRDGYAPLPAFLPREVANGFMARMQADLRQQGVSLEQLRREGPLLRQAASEIYGFHYAPLATFHWGMTPAIERLVGEPILPTYAYFRLYRGGDICRVHGDRYACEHSLSLTLAYSHDRPWALEVASQRVERPYERADAGFGAEEATGSVAITRATPCCTRASIITTVARLPIRTTGLLTCFYIGSGAKGLMPAKPSTSRCRRHASSSKRGAPPVADDASRSCRLQARARQRPCATTPGLLDND